MDKLKLLRSVHLRTLGLQGPSVPCVFPGVLVCFPVLSPKWGCVFVSGLVARSCFFRVFWPNGSVSSGFGFGSFFRFWFSGWGRGSGLVFGGCFGLGLGLCCSLAFLHPLLHRKTALPGIRPQRRLPPFPPPIGLSGVTRLLLGAVPCTGRSVAGWECRRLCDPTNSRTHTTIIIIVCPGHRWPPLQRTQAVSPAPGFFGGFLFFVCNAT